MLAAHRTFQIDIRGLCETYVIVTIFKEHEGFWKLSRIGSLNDKRCLIQITNNRCIKDKVNHLGWSLDLPKRKTAARGDKLVDWHETK